MPAALVVASVVLVPATATVPSAPTATEPPLAFCRPETILVDRSLPEESYFSSTTPWAPWTGWLFTEPVALANR